MCRCGGFGIPKGYDYSVVIYEDVFLSLLHMEMICQTIVDFHMALVGARGSSLTLRRENDPYVWGGSPI